MKPADDKIHIKPSDGPCEVHAWETDGLAKRLVDAMRERHGKGGINACRGCIYRAKSDAEAMKAECLARRLAPDGAPVAEPSADVVGFLDIDGVLNSHKYLQRLVGVIPKRFDERDEMMLDPSKIALLNDLTKRHDVKWVLSSSWRLAHSLERMRALLRARGFEGELIDRTPDIGVSTTGVIVVSPERGHEIQAWLNAHPVKAFVILDDSSDMAHLAPHLVQTTYDEGLEPEHIERASQHLRAQIHRHVHIL